MKLLKFIMFLFYRYYSKGGTYRIPYFSTLCAVVMLVYIHIFQLLIIVNKVDFILPLKKNDGWPLKYLKMALIFLPLFLILNVLVKEKDLRSLKYPIDSIRKGNIAIVVYIMLSVALLFLLIILIPKK
jgi:hypothetical protein